MSAVEKVGQREYALLLRARMGRMKMSPVKYHMGADLMTEGEKERLAARRLVARGLLVHHFPGAGPGHPLRRFYSLTWYGRMCDLSVPLRWDVRS